MRLPTLGSARTWRRSLGELSLIVIGVLIALGANSWWDGRQDRARERTYLQQLLVDTRENQERIRGAITSDSTSLVQLERFVDLARGDGSPASEDSPRLALSASGFQPLTGTYKALMQSGDVQLLRSNAVRLELISYAALLEAVQEVLQLTIMQTWRNIEVVLQRPEMQSPVELFRSDMELVGAVQMQLQVGVQRLEALRGLEGPTCRLRCLLEAEVEPVDAIDVELGSASIEPGETTDLQATVRLASGVVLEGCEVSWASDDEDVASVDEGVVTGIAEGDATITATFRQASGSAHVSVQPATE